MKELGTFLATIAGPLSKKLLTALGIGWLTYSGLEMIGQQVQAAVLNNWGGMPASMLQVLSMAGFSEGVGIILGAFSARIALIAVGRLGKIAA